MASTSASRAGGVTGRIRHAAVTLQDDNQAIVAEILKAFGMLKEVAVALEKDNQTQKVKELEKAAVELLQTYEDCMHFSTAIKSVGDTYEPGPELTDFGKVFDHEIAKEKSNSSTDPQNHPLVRQFREAVWNVHHCGQPMPGEEQDDVIMTSTQGNLLNVTCPLSGKPVTELLAPVRSVECKHIYEKEVILHYIRSKGGNSKCPIGACPKVLSADKVSCDPMLLYEIEEMRSMNKRNAATEVVEDFTALGEEGDD
ncbi:E3 SUMO-protein ligase MMS21 isoform X1 [Rhodamnia argentea]|uniref:E3 SUMO-protein ligase MMS21 isoform X1 n=1 Tax=Rhodamnia argentea TaxID=178133 RepID=A0A8B8QT78_9MYRT|nr:E3 SUMO-protein ligase MMS21 isoform X1 [Rhodamnia argentea]